MNRNKLELRDLKARYEAAWASGDNAALQSIELQANAQGAGFYVQDGRVYVHYNKQHPLSAFVD